MVPLHRFRGRAVAGWGVAALCLIWVFHDVKIQPMLDAVRELRWTWVALAIAVDILTYIAQAFRWKLLLEPIGKLHWLAAARAIYAGLFASEVLPFRAGEVVRAFLVSAELGTNVSAVFPSIVVERFFDGVWLAIGLGVTAMRVQLPAAVLRAGDVLGLLILAATALFLYVVLRTPHRPLSPATSASLVTKTIDVLRHNLHEIGRRRETYLAFGLSLPVLLGQMVAFWLVTIAYGHLHLSFWAGAATFIVIQLGTAIPASPANVGTYQLFCIAALTLFGIDKTVAAGFSMVVFVVLTLPFWLLGSVAVARSGTTWAGIRMRISESRTSR
jgi:glycosyltransferase 2 family protein